MDGLLPAEDVLLQYVFEDELGLHSLDDMFFKPDKRGTRILFNDSSGKGDVLYGETGYGNLIWDANGNLYMSGPHSKGFQAYGKLGPGSVLSNTENAGNRSDARFGSATMLAALLESPVVQNLVEGRGPNGETKGADKLIVSRIRKDFADPKKPFLSSSGAQYEDTWPRLMAFIGAVNNAFREREIEKGIPNPLFELMFYNAEGAGRDLVDMFLVTDKEGRTFIAPSADGINKIGLGRLPGESDEDFYKRQADNINRHMETLDLHDEVSSEEYYDWVIDKMVRNLRAAANALSKRDQAMRKASLEKRSSRASMFNDSILYAVKGIEKEQGKLKRSDEGIRMLIDRNSKNVKAIEAAMEKIESWPERNSLDDRIAALEKKREAAAKLYASSAAGLEEKKDDSSDKAEFKRAQGRLRGAIKASEAMEREASSQIERLKKLKKKKGGEDYSVSFCLTWLGDLGGRVRERIQELERKRKELKRKLDELDSKLKELDNPAGGVKHETFRPGIRLYQMAVPRDKIVTLDDYYIKKQAVAPVINSNMRMVATGILLGGTGMPLEEVKDNCDRYFKLRQHGKHGRESFLELFGVDPTRIPSDERLKNFHHSWKRIGEARDTQRNIIDAVHRRFF